MYQTTKLAKQRLRAAATAACRMLAPPPRQTVTEWAEAYRRLSPETSARPGPYSVAHTPYCREIMDSFTDRRVRDVVVVSSAQVGKTTMIENLLGYVIAVDPGPVMVVQPTLEMAETFSRDRVDPMIRDTPVLLAKVARAGSRSGGNTLRYKRFAGGQLAVSGANSAASLRSRPVRYLLLDEVDAYEGSVDDDGDPIEMARKRTVAFGALARIMYVSTPGMSHASPITKRFERSDQRHPYCRCPGCGEWFVWNWEGVRWTEGQDRVRADGTTMKHATAAWSECTACQHRIDDAARVRMISGTDWRPHAEFRGTRGYWLWQWYSPFIRLVDTVNEWLQAAGNPAAEQVFVNQALARTYQAQGDTANWEVLKARSEDYPLGTVPARGLLLTAGVDVQRDRLEVQVRAWAAGYENWLVDHEVIMGTPADPETWRRLTVFLSRDWPRADGGTSFVRVAAVDSGYATQEVYGYIRSAGVPNCEVIALDPRTSGATILGQATYVDVSLGGQKIRRGVRLYPANVNIAKEKLLLALARLDPPAADAVAPGYCHHPIMSEEFWRQLTAEEFVYARNKRTGVYSGYWRKVRERNEAWDCFVYALAAAERARVGQMTAADWQALADFVRPGDRPAPASKQPAAPSFWDGGRRPHW